MEAERRRELMLEAVRLSAAQTANGAGGPFGALIVRDGVVIAKGWNRVTSENDPTAHAEVTAIRAACAALGSFALAGCEIFTSCEPCPMCLAAIYWARLDRITYSNTRADAAAIGFDDSLIYEEVAKPIGARIIPMARLALPEAAEVFAAWDANPDKVAY